MSGEGNTFHCCSDFFGRVPGDIRKLQPSFCKSIVSQSDIERQPIQTHLIRDGLPAVLRAKDTSFLGDDTRTTHDFLVTPITQRILENLNFIDQHRNTI